MAAQAGPCTVGAVSRIKVQLKPPLAAFVAVALIAATSCSFAAEFAAGETGPGWVPLYTNGRGPVGWQHCGPITWKTDGDVPDEVVAAITDAFDEVSEITGYTFEQVPSTARPARISYGYDFSHLDAPPVIAHVTVRRWSAAEWRGNVDKPHRDTIAYVTAQPDDATRSLIWAEMHYSAGELEPLDAYSRNVLWHEVGHVMGLGHVPHRSSMMVEGPKAASTFSAEDRAGLVALSEAGAEMTAITNTPRC